MLPRLALTSAVVLALPGLAFAQAGRGRAGGAEQGAPAEALVRTASVSGRVVDADSGQPIPGALVRMQSRQLAAAATAERGGRGSGPARPPILPPNADPPGSVHVVTDSDGHFRFVALPAGATQLTPSAAGYLPPRTANRAIQLQDGEQHTGIELRLSKAASVSGIVTDEAGEPVVGISVRVLRRQVPAGVPRWGYDGAVGRTDDRGLYRIDGIHPGQVYILVPQTQTIVPAAELDKVNPGLQMVNPLMEALTGGARGPLTMPSSLRLGDRAIRVGGAGDVMTPPPPVNGRIAAYPSTLYPAATSLAQAATLTLASGDQRMGVDIQVRPVASVSVTGTLVGPGGPSAGTIIRLVPSPGTPNEEALLVARTSTDSEGRFAFPSVPSGSYVAKAEAVSGGGAMPAMFNDAMAQMPPEVAAQLQARMAGQARSTAYLAAPIEVADRDVTDVSLALRPGVKVRGAVVFDGAASPPPAASLQVQFTALGGTTTVSSKVQPDLTFESPDLPQGTTGVSVTGAPAAWLLDTVAVGGRSSRYHTVETGAGGASNVVLTFTDRAAAIRGTVRASGGDALPNVTVVLVATDYADAIDRGIAPTANMVPVPTTGAFTLSRLRAGDYVVIALPDDAVPAERDAAFFDAVTRLGTRVTVSSGEQRSLDLVLVAGIR